MSDFIGKFGPVTGRVLVALIFLWSGIGKIGGFAGTAGYMASKGLPMVEVLLVLTIVIEVGGSLMLIVGWKARWAAAVMFLWLVPVTLAMHNFWAVPPAEVMGQQINFMKNLAIMGAMLFIMAFGAGPYGVDQK